MKRDPVTWPEPAEEAMLGVIVRDLLTDADLVGHAECRFRRYRIIADRLGRRRRLRVRTAEGTLLDLET